jgi:hypothetical protein
MVRCLLDLLCLVEWHQCSNDLFVLKELKNTVRTYYYHPVFVAKSELYIREQLHFI